MSLVELRSADRMTGPQKAAVVLMSMGTERAAKV
jgi:flagellar motor switch protein FliG